MKKINYTIQLFLFVFVLAAAAALWLYFSPGSDWQSVRYACYLIYGVFLVAAAIYPLSGVILLSFCAPLLSVIPLYLTKGSPYPVVLFAGLGFVAGWLANQIIKRKTFEYFNGMEWLVALAAIAFISILGVVFRYFPLWMWKDFSFLSEIVNHKNMTRLDAVRYALFVFANLYLGIFLICAVQNILRKWKHKSINIQIIIVWTVLLGAACAAAFAIYQESYNLHFCANKSYYWIRLKRVNGTCTDPNALGAFISLCISITLLKIFFSGSNRTIIAWIQRAVALVLTFVFLLAIQYSGSRTALLSTLLALSCAVFVGVYYYSDILTKKLKHSGLIKFIIVILMVAAYVTGILMIPKAIKYADKKMKVSRTSTPLMRRLKRDIRIFKRYGGGALGLINDKRRLLYWRYAKKMWKDYPFSGIGLGSYVIELPNYTSASKERLFRVDNACNFYLHYGAEMGFPAILFLGLFFGTVVVFMVRGVKNASKIHNFNYHQKLVLLIVLPIYLIILIFGVHTLAYEFNVAFSILLGVMVSYNEFSEKIIDKKTTIRDAKYIIAALILVLLAFYAWRVIENNKTSLNCERRQAAYGLKIEKGWGKWEHWKGVPFKHRWIKSVAHATLKRENLLIAFPIVSGNPKLAENPQKISFFINGVKMKETILDKPGEWKLIKIPAPYANPFIHSFSPEISVRIEVDKLWSPNAVSTNEDVRLLGITVGKHRWLSPEGESGGWYGKEKYNGVPCRWSGKYAWEKVPIGENHKIKIPLSAANILLKWWPLNLAVYFNNQYVDTVTFENKTWKNYTYPIPEKFPTGSTGIVEFISERTWIPKHYGFDDPRNLGVAVGDIITE